MTRQRRSVNPVVARRRMLAAQAVGLILLALVTLFFVYKGLSVA